VKGDIARRSAVVDIFILSCHVTSWPPSWVWSNRK